MPKIFDILLADGCIDASDVAETADGFYAVNKSISFLLSTKNIFDFSDSCGERLACDLFYDDWFLYAVSKDAEHVYSLFKLREQEHDTESGAPSDGDTPGVTISFISFACEVLIDCLADPSEENRKRLNDEINRVVARKGQRHDKVLKQYFRNPHSLGSYLVANLYVKHIASFAEGGVLQVSDHYKEIVQKSISYKNSSAFSRLPRFIEAVNRAAGYVVCDNEKIIIKNREELTPYEAVAILATHTGNTSLWSFAAEVEYHAKFLTPLAKIKIPFFGRSVYDSAIRADMTIDDSEFDGPAPFYQDGSKIVRRQRELHYNQRF